MVVLDYTSSYPLQYELQAMVHACGNLTKRLFSNLFIDVRCGGRRTVMAAFDQSLYNERMQAMVHKCNNLTSYLFLDMLYRCAEHRPS